MMTTTQQQVEIGIKRLVKGKSSVENDTKSNGPVPELMSRRIIKRVLQEEVRESVAQLESFMKECTLSRE
jgi:hypothetical protein